MAAVTLVIGGVVKGSLGVGLPLVAVPLLALWLPSGQAIALLAAPVVLSNLIQSLEGGRLSDVWRRFRGLIVAQLIVTVATVSFTVHLSTTQLSAMIAGSVLLAVALLALQPNVTVPARHQPSVGVVVGVCSGLLGGVSSLTGPILITYLMALRLKRDDFVRSISLIYLTGSLPLYGAMVAFGRIAWSDLGLSLLALVPVYLGMQMGRAVRQRLDEHRFRAIVLGFLVVVAMVLVVKA